MARVYRGLAAVRDKMVEHASVAELDKLFLSHLDASKDVVYGRVVRHVGQQSTEDLPLETLEAFDYLGI